MTRSKSASSPAKKGRSSSRAKSATNNEDVIVDVQDKKRIGGVDHFLVKWSKTSKKDSWETAADVNAVAKSLVDKFESEQNKGDQEYVVEKLVDRKRTKDGISYYVKWEGYGMDENTWETESSLPSGKIKDYERQYGKLAPKRTKKEITENGDEEAAEESPKKKSPRKATKQAAAKQTSDISMIKDRKIINNVLHYDVKFVGKPNIKTMPIFEIEDIQAICDWEREQFAAGFNEISEETEYTVEKILSKRGTGKRTEYRVKWLGYPMSQNTWETKDNLSGALKLVAEFDKKAEERELKLAEKDYEVEKIVDEKMYKKKTCYLVKWKGYSAKQNTWEPEDGLKETAAEKIDQWQVDKVKKAEKREISRKKREEKKAERKAKKEEEKAKAAAEKSAEKPTEEAKEPEQAAEENGTAADEPAAE